MPLIDSHHGELHWKDGSGEKKMCITNDIKRKIYTRLKSVGVGATERFGVGLGVHRGVAQRPSIVIIGYHDENITKTVARVMLYINGTFLGLKLGKTWKGSWEDGRTWEQKKKESRQSNGGVCVATTVSPLQQPILIKRLLPKKMKRNWMVQISWSKPLYIAGGKRDKFWNIFSCATISNDVLIANLRSSYTLWTLIGGEKRRQNPTDFRL